MSSSAALVNTQLPLTEGKHEKRRVVYSVPIPAPRKGEVLAFDASFASEINALRFNTFIGSRVLDGPRPDRHHVGGPREDRDPAARPGDRVQRLQLHAGPSGYANPCTTVKAGATRIRAT